MPDACSTIAAALSAIGSLTGLARLLPERDPHPELYAATLDILRAFDDAGLWPTLFVRWELQLLGELGFGLDLSECAATGVDADLIYVSPRSGRAVSRDAGKPYCDRLLKLPAFLLDETAPASDGDILAGLALTGHFLERDMLEPHGLVHAAGARAAHPDPRPAAQGGPVGVSSEAMLPRTAALSPPRRCAKREAWERGFRRLIRKGRSSP